jgi:hypothetical protein
MSLLARYSRCTHSLYAYQLRDGAGWWQSNGVDPLVVAMMHAASGYLRLAHIDALICSDPAVYARLPKIHRDQSRAQGLDRLKLIRFLQIAQTLTVHNSALAHLLGINALRASEAAAVRIEDHADTLRGSSCTLSAWATSQPPCHSPSRCSGSWRPATASAPLGHRYCDRSPATRSTDATPSGWSPGSPKPPASHGHQPTLTPARRDHQRLGRGRTTRPRTSAAVIRPRLTPSRAPARRVSARSRWAFGQTFASFADRTSPRDGSGDARRTGAEHASRQLW